MKTKLMLLALLAAAPMASQAAMVEMNETELSDVSGQASFTIPGLLMDRTVEFGVKDTFVAPDYKREYKDVLGGVERTSGIGTSYTVEPYFKYESTGNWTGNSYRTVDSKVPFDVWDINYSRVRTDLAFNPDR